MFKLIESINNLYEKLYLYFKSVNILQLLKVFICIGLFSGFFLSIITYVERIHAYGMHLSLINKLQTFLLSISLLSTGGLIAGIIEAILIIISMYLFIGLTNLTKKQEKVSPYKVIILYSIISSSITVYLLIVLFIESSSKLISMFLSDNTVLSIIIAVFVLLMLLVFLLLVFSLFQKYLLKHIIQNNKLKTLLFVSSIIIWISVIYLYLNANLLKEILKTLNFTASEFLGFYNTLWVKFLQLYSGNIFLVDLILFLILTLIYLILFYILTYIINFCLKLKYLRESILVINFIIVFIFYMMCQNYFPYQLFMALSTTIILIMCSVITIISIQVIVYLINKLWLVKYTCKINFKKCMISFIPVLAIILLFNVYLFGQNNTVRAFIYRYCNYEKIALCLPQVVKLDTQLPLIQPKMKKLAEIETNYLTLKPKSLKSKPNIILITVDALRNDMFQEIVETTPGAFRDFVNESYNFKHCYTHAPYTVASTSSFFTSHYLASKADIDYNTIAEILRASGYETYSLTVFKDKKLFGLITIKNKNYKSLFYKGFEGVDKPVGNDFEIQKDQLLVSKFKKFIRNRNKQKPLFAWMHLAELHLIPSTVVFETMFSNKPYLDKYSKVLKIENNYFKEIFKALKENGYYDNSIIILSADHGESAKDHGDLFHVYMLYQEYINVPFVIKLPGITEHKNEEIPISLLDLTPTLLDYIGYDYSNLQLNGKTLLPLFDNHSIKEVPVISSVYLYKEKLPLSYSLYGNKDYYPKTVVETSVIDQNNKWKFIHNMYFGFDELYDLKNDPKELNNLIDQKKEIGQRMLQKIHNALFLKK